MYIILLFIHILHKVAHPGGNNYNAPLSKVVNLQNEAVRIININDVPLMEPITPHYAALALLKVPDIDKLNTSLLLYDYFNADKHSN